MRAAKAKVFLACTICALLASPAFADDEPAGVNYLLGTLGLGASGLGPSSVKAQQGKSATAQIAAREQTANSLAIPNPILATGSDLHSESLSPNALALANQIGLVDQFARLPQLKARAEAGTVPAWIEYFEAREDISDKLRGAEMDVNYVLSEIYDEQAVYNELVSTYSGERDKLIAKTNAVSFGTNGALWSLSEALAIPTVTRANFAIPAGATGILAGIIPSVASALTLRQVNGKKYSEPAAANMLAKIFGRPTSPELEYPSLVWDFLNSSPADNPNKKRKDLIVDRWIADSNIPAFTDRNSKTQIDTITAATKQKKTITIAVLSSRLSMLSQLSSEVFKMNRLLDEMEMALRGTKHVDAALASVDNHEAQ